ncbi:MAG TPA: hypothetical protein VGX76_15380, partial [Pirellulales bacterium]|nr:hypothetical protein [Pirellulales bacterium]
VRSPDELYEMAGCHALLGGVAGAPESGVNVAEGQAAAERALEVLRQAITAGYRNLPEMRNDRCLEALRPREKFQELVHNLEHDS